MAQVGGWFTVGPDRLRRCNRCGAQGLGWVRSKTGRYYLAQTRPYRSDDHATDSYWVMPNMPHSCAAHEAARDRQEQEAARSQQTADFCREVMRVVDALAAGEITREEYAAALTALSST